MANVNNSYEILPTIDLNNEENRLTTFNSNWPHAYISPRILAKTGFFYIGPFDQVKCHFCKIKISSWEMGDNEITEHERWSMNCPLLNRCDTSNIPIHPTTELNEVLSAVSRNLCEIYRSIEAFAETPFILQPIVDCNTLNQTVQNPDFPEFANEKARLETFDGWPKSSEQSPQLLSQAGFFYTQKRDRVICFSCGGGLCDWTKEDDPWEQHAWWYNKCSHVRLIKGQAYIIAVYQKFTSINNFFSIQNISKN